MDHHKKCLCSENEKPGKIAKQVEPNSLDLRRSFEHWMVEFSDYFQ